MAVEFSPFKPGNIDLNEVVNGDPYFLFVLRDTNADETEVSLDATVQLDGWNTDEKLDYLAQGLIQIAQQI